MPLTFRLDKKSHSLEQRKVLSESNKGRPLITTAPWRNCSGWSAYLIITARLLMPLAVIRRSE